jgi:hypothetical protein
VVTFQGRSIAELKTAFRGSIDDYLAFSKQRGEEPNKPFSGHVHLWAGGIPKGVIPERMGGSLTMAGAECFARMPKKHPPGETLS